MAAESNNWLDTLDDPAAAVSEMLDKLSSTGAASDALRVLHDYADPMERLMGLYAVEQRLKPLRQNPTDDPISEWAPSVEAPNHDSIGLTPEDIIRMPWVRKAVGNTVTAIGGLTMAICTLQLIRMMGTGINPDVTAPEYVQGAVVGTMMYASGIAIRGQN
jgi:hypothetical protein